MSHSDKMWKTFKSYLLTHSGTESWTSLWPRSNSFICIHCFSHVRIVWRVRVWSLRFVCVCVCVCVCVWVGGVSGEQIVTISDSNMYVGQTQSVFVLLYLLSASHSLFSSVKTSSADSCLQTRQILSCKLQHSQTLWCVSLWPARYWLNFHSWKLSVWHTFCQQLLWWRRHFLFLLLTYCQCSNSGRDCCDWLLVVFKWNF